MLVNMATQVVLLISAGVVGYSGFKHPDNNTSIIHYCGVVCLLLAALIVNHLTFC